MINDRSRMKLDAQTSDDSIHEQWHRMLPIFSPRTWREE